MGKRLAGRVVSSSLISAVLLAGVSFASHAKPQQDGVLHVALGSNTPIIDPSITAHYVMASITRNVVDSLVGQAEDTLNGTGDCGLSYRVTPAITAQHDSPMVSKQADK